MANLSAAKTRSTHQYSPSIDSSDYSGGGVVGQVVRFVEESSKPMRMYTGDSWIDRVRGM
jgi:hypothetical protein